MDQVKVVVTGAGAPGIQGTVFSLRKNYDGRPVRIVGTDAKNDVVGKYLCDSFHVISPARNEKRYLEDLLRVCSAENAEVILPQNTSELGVLAGHAPLFGQRGVKIAVSPGDTIAVANNKQSLYGVAREHHIPVAESVLASNFDDLKKAAAGLGWPEKRIVVKPPVSNGSRGVRIIDESFDRKKAFYEEKPSNLHTTLGGLHDVLGESFPELMVMEYLPGDEYTVDLFSHNGRLTAIPRKRVAIHGGITFTARLERNEEIIRHAERLALCTGLRYCFGFQFKMNAANRPVLLESNPRIQGTMVATTFAGANIIYSAVKALLGEEVPPFDVKWDTELYRYWGSVGVHGRETVVV